LLLFLDSLSLSPLLSVSFILLGFRGISLDYSDENGNGSGGETEDDNANNSNSSSKNNNNSDSENDISSEKERLNNSANNEIPLHNHNRSNDDDAASDVDDDDEKSTTESAKPPRNLTRPCDADRGGCDHECQMVQHEEDPDNPRIQCSCYAGFTLDEYDGRRCHGKLQIAH